MKIIQPPEEFIPDGKYSIFLAGSIEMGRADDWQSQVCEDFKEFDINILNPRRKDWDSSWIQTIDNPHFREQVAWELKNLELADLILMYLQPNTLSPISMLEFGLYAKSGKMILCCPDGFWRKGNIDIVCGRNPVILTESFELFYRYAKHRILSNGKITI